MAGWQVGGDGGDRSKWRRVAGGRESPPPVREVTEGCSRFAHAASLKTRSWGSRRRSSLSPLSMVATLVTAITGDNTSRCYNRRQELPILTGPAARFVGLLMGLGFGVNWILGWFWVKGRV